MRVLVEGLQSLNDHYEQNDSQNLLTRIQVLENSTPPQAVDENDHQYLLTRIQALENAIPAVDENGLQFLSTRIQTLENAPLSQRERTAPDTVFHLQERLSAIELSQPYPPTQPELTLILPPSTTSTIVLLNLKRD